MKWNPMQAKMDVAPSRLYFINCTRSTTCQPLSVTLYHFSQHIHLWCGVGAGACAVSMNEILCLIYGDGFRLQKATINRKHTNFDIYFVIMIGIIWPQNHLLHRQTYTSASGGRSLPCGQNKRITGKWDWCCSPPHSPRILCLRSAKKGMRTQKDWMGQTEGIKSSEWFKFSGTRFITNSVKCA